MAKDERFTYQIREALNEAIASREITKTQAEYLSNKMDIRLEPRKAIVFGHVFNGLDKNLGLQITTDTRGSHNIDMRPIIRELFGNPWGGTKVKLTVEEVLD